MPISTSHLNLNTWLESEVVDFEEINDNFKKIDALVSCTESGKKTANYTGGSDSVATWYYKKYTDKSIEMWAKLNFTNLKCDGGTKSPYYSVDSKVFFPFVLSDVIDVQMHLASNTIGWISDITERSVLDYVRFKVMATEKEVTTLYKRIYISVKGVLQ